MLNRVVESRSRFSQWHESVPCVDRTDIWFSPLRKITKIAADQRVLMRVGQDRQEDVCDAKI
jgi:hypothetical protein